MRTGMYTTLARYYDLIYKNKDYQREADDLIRLIAKHKKSKGYELLDVACGTGNHLKYLQRRFRCTGLDLNAEMLKIARTKVNAELVCADMANFHLGKKFDVITCLFSAIGYVLTYERLGETIRNLQKHLKPGGILIIEPWYSRDELRDGVPQMATYDSKDLKIARLSVTGVTETETRIHMHYLIAETGNSVKHLSEVHKLGNFEIHEILSLMRQAGMKVVYIKKALRSGRGLLVGTRE
jgi:ubiquinone/menaquinone biosynthesis C-methylase UbiE